MADKRIYQLSTATNLTGQYVQVDKSGNSEAEKWLVTDFVSAVQSTDVTANTNWQTGYKAQFGDSNEFAVYYGTKGATLTNNWIYLEGNMTCASDVYLGSIDAGSTFVGTAYAETQSSGDNSTKVATTAYVDAAVLSEDLFDLADDYTINAKYPLNIAALRILPDSGVVTIASQGVGTELSYGDELGFKLDIDGNFFEYKGTVDGAGGISDVKGYIGDSEVITTETGAENYTSRQLLNGTFQESFDALITSDGATITCSIEQSGTGDLTMQFSTGNFTLDCTPAATVTLTAGTIASPQENFIYVPISTKTLTKSTTGWPSEEHIKVTYTYVQTAAYVASDGALINQNWNDHLKGSNGMGHLAHMAERSRRLGAVYFSGLNGTGGDDYTTSSASTVTVQVGSGVIYQMHQHTYSAKDTSGTDDIHVVNENGGAYFETQNLYDVTVDASGGTLTNRYFNIVLWGVANKTGEYSPLMVNMPTGSYNNLADAKGDISGYDVFAIPRQFNKESSTGFLIARLTFRKTGGTWVYQSTVDLRGSTPTTASGGGAGGTVFEYPDSLFRIHDNSDATKKIAFEASGISAGNTRTFTLPNYNATLATLGGNETLTSKTLTTPTIADFTNATHNHEDNAGGGTLAVAAISDFDTEVSNNTDVAANTSARHSAVTVSGSYDYITLSGQDIVRGQIDLATDVTGVLPDANVADDITLTNITQITNRSHTNLSDIGTNTHTQIDTHIASTSNPHNVTYDQLDLANDTWTTGSDHLGNDTNIYKISTVDTLRFGLPLEISSLYILPDSGIITVGDMGVTAGSSYGDPMGFQFVVGGSMLKFSADADGAGGLVATPTLTIDGVEVGGTYTFSTGLSETGGTVTTNDSEIDHNSLDNYVADQHIDWTGASDNLITSGYGKFGVNTKVGDSGGFSIFENLSGGTRLKSSATNLALQGFQGGNTAFYWTATGDFELHRAGTKLFESNSTGVNIASGKTYQINGTSIFATANVWTADQRFNDTEKIEFGTGGASYIYNDGAGTMHINCGSSQDLLFEEGASEILKYSQATGDWRIGGSSTNTILSSSGNIDADGTLRAGGQVTFDGLPTSNPGGSGLLWNDSGTIKIT